jgi:hypothetical protein
LQDPFYSYHYSQSLIEELVGQPVTSRLNVGIVGLNSDQIDWQQVEYWIKALERVEGSSYLLEQALTAMIAAGQVPIIANEKDYIVLPAVKEVNHPVAVMHHYVDRSKEWYYKSAWRKII